MADLELRVYRATCPVKSGVHTPVVEIGLCTPCAPQKMPSAVTHELQSTPE